VSPHSHRCHLSRASRVIEKKREGKGGRTVRRFKSREERKKGKRGGERGGPSITFPKICWAKNQRGGSLISEQEKGEERKKERPSLHRGREKGKSDLLFL